MLHTLFVIVKWLAIIIILLAIAIVAFLQFAPTFGGKPDAQSQTRIANSPHFDGDVFVNLVPTQTSTRSANSPSMASTLWGLVSPPADKNPSEPLLTRDFSYQNQPMSDGSMVWLGHSTVLFRTAGKTIVTDPVFHRASPVPLGGKAFEMTDAPSMDDLPEQIDAVLISHDHYDHLDHLAIQKLDDKVNHFYVPLGVKAHLQRWGIADEKITEMDWYDEQTLGDVQLVFTPSRHFSGRKLTGQMTTLWGSWVVKSPALSLYFSGDGGYSPEFAKIGERFGPFDIALMEDGAYNEDWAEIHMFPEQSAQAAVDLNANALLPVHWSKFDLARHEWRDPIRRIHQAVQSTDVTLTTPRIGQVFTLQSLPQSQWWESPYSESSTEQAAPAAPQSSDNPNSPTDSTPAGNTPNADSENNTNASNLTG